MQGIGVATIIRNKHNQILWGKRKGGNSDGLWSVAGGKIDFGESALDAATRELQEETGIIIPSNYLTFDNYYEWHDFTNHWITLIFNGYSNDTPLLKEPEKFYTWVWLYPEEYKVLSLFGPIQSWVTTH